jgi:hypothetical protein
MEKWNIGLMDCWISGLMENLLMIFPIIQQSINPPIHHSITPYIHPSAMGLHHGERWQK